VCFTGWTKLITAECIPYGTASRRCSKNKDVIARGLVIAPTFQLVKSHSAAPARLAEFVEPMQAKLVHSMRPGDWIYEIKLDGYRALALRGGTETRILSRSEKDLGGKFPEVMNSIAALDVQDAIIEGEIVALDEKGRSSFQLLQGFDMGQERPPIVFYAFDLLRLNGKNLQILPIEERKAKLEDLLKKPPGVIRYSVSFKRDIEELLSRTRRLGLEGLIGKRNGSRYEVGNAAEPGSSASSTRNRNSSSADTPNRTGLGSILVRCWRASMKRRD
jgi:bifunctional non-homologous end joining protein LigD